MASRTPKAEVYKRTDGLWDWRLHSGNGQIVATSGTQGYTERNDAIEALDRVAYLFKDGLEIEAPEENGLVLNG